MDALLALPVGKLDVSYTSKAEIDPTQPYIIAISHKTGLDIPIGVKALGGEFPLAISDQSTHHGPIKFKDPTTISVKLLGLENFPPISYFYDDDGEKKPIFDPTDVDPLVEAINQGKSILISAHNPSDEIPVQDIHTVKPGYAAALVAHMTGAKILPVLVDREEDKGVLGRLGHGDAHVFVGAPYSIETDPGMSNMRTIAQERKAGQVPTAKEVAEFKRLADVLRKTGRQVLDSVADLEPVK